MNFIKQQSKESKIVPIAVLPSGVGLENTGFAGRMDLKDWAIIYYIAYRQAKENATYIWFSYKRLIEEMPMLHITTKTGVAMRLKKLRDLELIDSFLEPGNKLYVALNYKKWGAMREVVKWMIEESKKLGVI